MSANTSLRLFELSAEFIRDKDKAKEFVTLVEATIDEKFDAQTTLLATKKDISDLRQETTEMGATIRQEMAKQGAKLESKISQFKADLLKTIYIVNLVQLFAIVVSILAIINFMLK